MYHTLQSAGHQPAALSKASDPATTIAVFVPGINTFQLKFKGVVLYQNTCSPRKASAAHMQTADCHFTWHAMVV